MAQGDAISFYKVGLADSANLEIKPGTDLGGSGDHWSIHELYIGSACSIQWTNGTQTITLATPTGVKWITNLFTHTTSSYWLRIRNTSGGPADFGYSGIQTK